MEKIDDYRWLIPKTNAMRVPGMVYSSRRLIKSVAADESILQVANVACLPGIVSYSLGMPDIHWGYGFPIGGVAAFDADEGIISPGGVGYDINCGCRVITTRLEYDNIRDDLPHLVADLFSAVPCGVGSRGMVKLSVAEEKKVLSQGARWAVAQGFGVSEDIETTEEGGCLDGADPGVVSDRALTRGRDQLGTLGSGNHFCEIEVVDTVFDAAVARAFDLSPGRIVIMLHTGSRGFGHQVCDDYLERMVKQRAKLDFDLPDVQLACAYLKSTLGREYRSAMACAANFAWANRQILTDIIRRSFQKTLQLSPRELGMRHLYDVCHNIAKEEILPVDGVPRNLMVHRKGATRAYPPGHKAVPECYRSVGQPVLIPGDMGTGSYILAGTNTAYRETFGSSCHGAGRLMSRNRARKVSAGRAIGRDMADRGVIVMARGRKTLAEEIPEAYKSLEDVVDAVHGAGIATKVARLRSVGCVKG